MASPRLGQPGCCYYCIAVFELLLLVSTSCDVHTPSLFPSRSKPVARHTRTAPLRIMKQKASRREKVLPASSTFGASMPVPSLPASSTSNPQASVAHPWHKIRFFLFFFPVHLHLARSHSRPPISTIPCNSAAICSQLDSVHETQAGRQRAIPYWALPRDCFFFRPSRKPPRKGTRYMHVPLLQSEFSC